MNALEFTEISENGEQFEFFCRDFLSELGLQIVSPPNRGSDGGRDLIAVERRIGNISNTDFKWLVSCKHYAGSGRSVGVSDEQSISDRVKGFNADGFLGFYSTIASSGLIASLERLVETNSISEFQIFDHRLIESILISKSMYLIMARYMPRSFGASRPLVKLWGEEIELRCHICDADLLSLEMVDQQKGIVVFGKDEDRNKQTVVEVRAVCKGECDFSYTSSLRKRALYSSWMEITNLCIPAFFSDYVRNVLGSAGNGEFDPDATEQLGEILRAISQRVMRLGTAAEQKRYMRLLEIDGII
jgi:hypothetical protein